MPLWRLQFLFEVQRLIWLKFSEWYGTRMVIPSLTIAYHCPCDEKNVYFPPIYACVFHELSFLSLPPELRVHFCAVYIHQSDPSPLDRRSSVWWMVGIMKFLKNTVFRDMTPCSLEKFAKVSEEPATLVFNPEDKVGRFLVNVFKFLPLDVFMPLKILLVSFTGTPVITPNFTLEAPHNSAPAAAPSLPPTSFKIFSPAACSCTSSRYVLVAVWKTKFNIHTQQKWRGTGWRSWLRHCATSRKVVGSMLSLEFFNNIFLSAAL